MTDLTTLTSSLAGMKSTLVDKLIALGDTDISTSDTMQKIVNHYDATRMTVVPITSIDPMSYTTSWDMSNTYDATAILNANIIAGTPGTSTGPGYTDIISNAEILTGTSYGSLYTRYLTSVAQLTLPKLKYVLGGNYGISYGTSSYKNTRVGGIMSFPELLGMFLPNTFSLILITYYTNITGLSAPKLEKVFNARGSTELSNAVDGCTALKYLNLSSYAGNSNHTITTMLIGTTNTAMECLILGDVHTISNYIFSSTTTYSAFNTYVFKTTQVPTLTYSSHLISSTSYFPKFASGGTGKIYVPDSLVNDYKAATNWSTFAEFIHPLSEFVNPYE